MLTISNTIYTGLELLACVIRQQKVIKIQLDPFADNMTIDICKSRKDHGKTILLSLL